MRVKKGTIWKELCLLAISTVAYAMISLSNALYIHIAAMLLVCVTAAALVQFDLMHPYFWFSVFFGLYSIGYPLILATGFTSKIGYSRENMLYQLLALVTVLIIIGPGRQKPDLNKIRDNYSISLGVLNKAIYVVLISLIVIGAVFVSRRGFSGKDDIYQTGSKLLVMIFRLPLILTMLYALSVTATYFRTGKFPVTQSLTTLAALLLITLFSGERDFIFRFLLTNIFVLWFLKIITLRHLLIMVPIVVVLIPLSSMYKYYFLSGSASALNNNIVYSFLSGEFESASRNLQLLINNSATVLGSKGFGQLGKDVLSVFNSSIRSLPTWFNNIFYPNSRVQYGFSLVGEGYVIGGAIGVIAVFAIAGLITRYMYNHAYRGIYSLAAYIYYICVTVYSFRADLGTIYSALVKQILLVLLILYAAERIAKRRQ